MLFRSFLNIVKGDPFCLAFIRIKSYDYYELNRTFPLESDKLGQRGGGSTGSKRRDHLFFEQRWEGEPEPSVELLLGKVDGVVRRLLNRHDLSVHKFNGHTIWDAEAFAELPHIQLVHGLLRVNIFKRNFVALSGRARRSSFLVRRHS